MILILISILLIILRLTTPLGSNDLPQDSTGTNTSSTITSTSTSTSTSTTVNHFPTRSSLPITTDIQSTTVAVRRLAAVSRQQLLVRSLVLDAKGLPLSSTFYTSNGLTNQFIEYGSALVVANATNRFNVVFAGIKINYNDKNISQPVLLPFDQVFDVDHLRQQVLPSLGLAHLHITALQDKVLPKHFQVISGTLYEDNDTSTVSPQITVDFHLKPDGWIGDLNMQQYILLYNDPIYQSFSNIIAQAPFFYGHNIVDNFIANAKFADHLENLASAVMAELDLSPRGYSAIHLRLEDDMVTEFQRMHKREQQHHEGRNKTVPFATISNAMFHVYLKGLSQAAHRHKDLLSQPLFVATDLGKSQYTNNFLLNRLSKAVDGKLVTASRAQLRSHLAGKYGRETAAIIELLICERASKVFTSAYSTFSMTISFRVKASGIPVQHMDMLSVLKQPAFRLNRTYGASNLWTVDKIRHELSL